MAKGKNKSLAVGIVYKAVPIPQDGGFVDIHVRGLSLADFSALLADGGEDLGKMYRSLVHEAVKPEDVERVGLEILQSMPDMMAKIIAHAADLPDEWEMVRNFTIGAQIDLIQAVAVLTFASESVRKKALEIVNRYAKVENPADLLKPSKDGSGV